MYMNNDMDSFLAKLCKIDHFFYLILTDASALTVGKIYLILNKLMWVIFGVNWPIFYIYVILH